MSLPLPNNIPGIAGCSMDTGKQGTGKLYTVRVRQKVSTGVRFLNKRLLILN